MQDTELHGMLMYCYYCRRGDWINSVRVTSGATYTIIGCIWSLLIVLLIYPWVSI